MRPFSGFMVRPTETLPDSVMAKGCHTEELLLLGAFTEGRDRHLSGWTMARMPALSTRGLSQMLVPAVEGNGFACPVT